MTTNTTTRYFVHSWSGLIVSAIAGMAATSIIVSDAFPNGLSDWSHARLEHALAPVIVGLAAFLWLHAARAWKDNLISALLLSVVAVFCSGLIVFESMGRGAEALDTKVNEAAKDVNQFAAVMAKLDQANKDVAAAKSWEANECRTGIGKKCQGLRYILEQREAHAEKLEAEAKAHKAPPPVDARGERVAFLATLMGFNGETAKKAAQLLYPLARPLAFEFVMILLLHASVRTRTVSQFPTVSSVSAPEKLTSFSVERELSDAEIEEIKRILGKQKKPVTNDELAGLMNVSKGEASKRVQKAVNAGIIEKLKAGKCNQIMLV